MKGKNRGFLHQKRRVIAHSINGKSNLVFDSIQECVSYFNEMGHQLKNAQVVRLLDGDGVWEYTETFEEEGVSVKRTVQMVFDELCDED